MAADDGPEPGRRRVDVESMQIVKDIKMDVPDLDDLPAEVRDSLVVSPVDTLAEALSITLRDTYLRDGRLWFGEHQPGVH